MTEISGWMEYLERSEGRSDDERGAGAYDTLRCDLVVGAVSAVPDRQEEGINNCGTLNGNTRLNNDEYADKNRWRIWGLDFHLRRLQNSYRSLLSPSEENAVTKRKRSPADLAGGGDDDDDVEFVIKEALVESHMLLNELLLQAEKSSLLNRVDSNGVDSDRDDDTSIQLIRMTFLWSPPLTKAVLPDEEAGSQSPSDCNEHRVVVRGHACSAAVAAKARRPVKPIAVSVAAVGHHRHNETASSDEIEVDTSLPTRYLDPQNKVAKWVRRRKEMEVPEYKPPGVSEVLMVRPSAVVVDGSPDVEVLEGLSSNFFVVYGDGTLRTAKDGVLHGYVRELVLDAAPSCGLKLDLTNPILLKDAREGMWREAFITSSSRLIFPISRVLVHTDDGAEFEEYWRDSVLTADDCDTSCSGRDRSLTAEKPKWQVLLDEIMKKGGYPALQDKNKQSTCK